MDTKIFEITGDFQIIPPGSTIIIQRGSKVEQVPPKKPDDTDDTDDRDDRDDLESARFLTVREDSGNVRYSLLYGPNRSASALDKTGGLIALQRQIELWNGGWSAAKLLYLKQEGE